MHKVEVLEHKTFAQLMSVAEIQPPAARSGSPVDDSEDGVRYFRSLVAAYRPSGSRGVFGGHVMAQSAYSASKTVPEGYICHNFHCYFLLPGKSDKPFYYKVTPVRDGKTYVTRQVHVYQPSGSAATAAGPAFLRRDLCFVALVSFKTPSRLRNPLVHQRPLKPHFGVEANRHAIPGLDLAPDVDLPLWIAVAREGGANVAGDEAHPLEVRKMDPSMHNEGVGEVAERSQMHYFKSHDVLDPHDANLQMAALLYVSDRNSLFTVANLQDRDVTLKQIASIDHSFVVHKLDARVDADWLAMEAFTGASSDGRGLYQGHIYDARDELVCSFMQDGVLGVFDDEDDETRGRVVESYKRQAAKTKTKL